MRTLKKLNLQQLETEAEVIRELDLKSILGGTGVITTVNMCFFDNMESFSNQFGCGFSENDLMNSFDSMFGAGAHFNVTPAMATQFCNSTFNAAHVDNNQIGSTVSAGTNVSTDYYTYTSGGTAITHAVTLTYYDSVHQTYIAKDTTSNTNIVLTASQVAAGGYAEAVYGCTP